MNTHFHRQELGAGIYTIPDISSILKLPLKKVGRYVRDYGDVRLGKMFDEKYSWTVGGVKAVNFYALIEMYVFFYLREELHFSPQKINKAREVMAKQLGTPYPLATLDVLTDGKAILYSLDSNLVNADGSQQLNIDSIVKPFLKKIEFDHENKAFRYYPLGKGASIVVDPHHQYGKPTINETNICAETIFLMHDSGESKKNIISLYDITEKQIDEVIHFYKKAA